MEKYFEDLRQDEKHVPDLLEAVTKPTDPVKEELRPNLFKIDKFRPEITKIRVWSKSQKFQNGFADHPSPFFEAANPFLQYLAPLGAKYIKKIMKNMKEK